MTTKELFRTNNFNYTSTTLKSNYYTETQYLDAISWIQSKSYTSISKSWGQQWRACLSRCLPFVLKLLRFGYNDFLVQRISSGNIKWLYYDENTALSLLQSNNIAAEVYYSGVAYPKMGIHRNNKPYVKEWRKLNPFVNRQTCTADSKALLRIINDLIQVGAMAKVSDALIVENTLEKYSSSYIISKDRLREIINLFITTFSSTLTHTTIHTTYTSSTTSSTTSLLSHNISYSTLGDICGGTLDKLGHFDTLLRWNNDRLPEDEKLSFEGRRAYAEVNSYINEEKHDTLPAGMMTIQKYANKVFGEDKWFEFDRRGSIYNLTRTLNGKGYLDNNIDIYELLNGKPFESKEERKYFKLTQMLVYFSNRQRTRGLLERVHNNITLNKPTSSKNYELADAFYNLLGCPDVSWDEFVGMVSADIERRQKIMKKVIGDNKRFIDKYGRRTPEEDKNPNHIFVHESKAYLYFVTKLREMNIRVVQVYDGFILPKDCGLTEEQLDKLLEESINEYIR